MKKSANNKKKVLITGGSSGLGYEISRHFAKDGYDLYWVAKSMEELASAKIQMQEEFANIEINILQINLTESSAPKTVYDWISEKVGSLDVLVNNAGFGTYGAFNETSMEREMEMIQVNVIGVYSLTKLFLKDMIKADHGKILNISSGVSFNPVPRMSVYAGTKAFVRQMSESISYELEYLKSKVTMTVVCPSAIKNTDFQNQADMKNVATFEGFFATTSEEVAKDAYEAMNLGKRLVLTGAKYRLGAKLTKVTPTFITQYAIKKEMERKS